MESSIHPINRYLFEGSVLNERYKIINILGSGGFSNTYRAIHIDMESPVAIKEFYCSDYMFRDVRITRDVHVIDASDKKRLTRDLEHFLDEAKILASLSGIEGIVRVIDYFRENETAYIVMELVEGLSLKEQLDSGYKYTWDEIIKKMLPITNALSLVHKKGLIHRDIKPDNLIITEDGTFKLIDFGAALHYVGEKTYSIYLSDGYAPKEQYLRNGKLGAYSDIYSLCAVIYHCLCGCVPDHSIQRAVNDELLPPSAMGIQLPASFENVLMKGLQSDPESRWQNMEEFSNALLLLLPKQPKFRILFYTFAGLSIAFIIIIGIYIAINYKELRIRQLASRGEVIEFSLQAPDEMTTDEFSNAVALVKERLNTFTGEKYLINQDLTGMSVIIPQNVFEDSLSSDDPGEEWSLDEILKVLFTFNGKWRVHNSDITSFFELSPQNITNVELNYGSIPLVSSSGENLFFNEEIDWSSKEIYYLKLSFDEDSASFMKEYLTQKGFLFAPVPHIQNGIFIRPWISNGDGKTAYYPIGPSNCRTIAETMFQILTNNTFSNALDITWLNEEIVSWDIPTKQNTFQKNIDQIKGPSVELISHITYGRDVNAIIAYCKSQLEVLNIPYAIGQNQRTLHIRLPSNKVNNLIAYSLFGGDIIIHSEWNIPKYIPNRYHATIVEPKDNCMISINLNFDEYPQISLDGKTFFSEYKYLYLGGTRIGVLASVAPKTNCLSYKLLLPDPSLDVVSRKNIMEYICSLINNRPIALLNASTEEIIWRDEKGLLIGKTHTPKLSEGVDLTRFSPLFTKIRALGGEAEYISDSFEEQISVTFEHWVGRFPEDALKQVETLYKEEKLDRNICSQINFHIKTWHNGEPAKLDVLFQTESSTHSVICTDGYIQVNDASAIDRAKKYIQSSKILMPPENRSKTDKGFMFTNTQWIYNNNSLLE